MQIIQTNSCKYEDVALMYFADQLKGQKLEIAQFHIADCGLCCETITNLLKMTYQEESSEETEYLNNNLSKSIEQAHKLLKFIDLLK